VDLAQATIHGDGRAESRVLARRHSSKNLIWVSKLKWGWSSAYWLLHGLSPPTTWACSGESSACGRAFLACTPPSMASPSRCRHGRRRYRGHRHCPSSGCPVAPQTCPSLARYRNLAVLSREPSPFAIRRREACQS
jgi:hypothetical protein